MDIRDSKRILIIGDAGRGKTTLSSRLSEILDIEMHSTDDYLWDIKFSKEADRIESISKIKEVYKNDKWLIEGATLHLLEHGLDKVDLIICLKHHNIFSQWWTLFKRHRKRRLDTFKTFLVLCKNVFYKRYNLGYKREEPSWRDFVSGHEHKVIELNSFSKIDNFLDSII